MIPRVDTCCRLEDSHFQSARSREQQHPDPNPPLSADDSPFSLRPSHAISDQTARTQASGVRNAALPIGVSFSSVSMDYSGNHFQLADVGIFYFLFFLNLLFWGYAPSGTIYSFFLLGST